jgi:cobyrinic acid a,c-diamide synthase
VSAAGLILAAPASGSGKTTLTLALLRHLTRAGVNVAGAKTGPDYIDPGFHAAATGRPALNLDPWAMRPDLINGLTAGIEADLVLCEGVMGLFDGAGARGDQGSTADLALLTGWPVVLVVDARGQSASIAALVQGFARHRPEVPVAGVICNGVGSPRHAGMLRAALATHLPDLPVLGCVTRNDALALPSRHLGLVLAEEHEALDGFLDAAARHVGEAVDIDALIALARPGREAETPARPVPPLGQRIAIARDAAFAFLYPHLVEDWRRQGAEIAFFSPLADQASDPAADAVFLPGGYPELHGGRLAAAGRFLSGLAEAAGRTIPVYGECGGYMVLGEALIDASGARHAMAGLLPVTTSMVGATRRLGYRRAGALGGPWAGRRCRGHEFHFGAVSESGPAEPLWRLADADGTDLGPAGHRLGSVAGSFFHLIDIERVS